MKINAIHKNREQIFQIAESRAKGYNFYPGEDISKVIEKQKGKIIPQDFCEWQFSNSIIVHGRNKDIRFTIYISNFTGPLRDRFTLAHALGHYVLHSNEGQKEITAARFKSDCTSKSEKLAYIQANQFASAFLMPKDKFKKVWIDTEHDVILIAGLFLVPVLAVEMCANDLKLTHTPYKVKEN